MRSYEVTKQCYVPVGPGLKFKRPGQIVTLDDEDAAELSAYLTPAKEGVAKRNSKAKPETKTDKTFTEPVKPPEEVKSDAGEPTPAVQRAGAEAVE